MGAINLHNRDRYYYNFGTSIYDPAQQDFTKYGAWGAPFHGPNSRGPVEVDTVHPITIRRNRLEVRQHVGLVGEPGEWWGRQNTLCVLDIDDGNGRYQIEENLLLATGTNGLKLGHIVDDITVTNNIVIARQGPPSVDLEVNDRQDLHAFNIGPQCLENTMNASNNIIVNLDGGTMLASTYGNYAGYSGCGNMSDAQCYLYLKPKISTMDRNVYWSKGGSVRMLPNQTAAQGKT